MGARNNNSRHVEDGPIKLWLVDDSKSFRSLLADFLKSEGGFECSRQFDSAEALLEGLAQETPPDVILLDVNMRGISGLEALRPIKAIASSTRVLMLTSLSDRDSKTQALRDGASDFLLKSSPMTIPHHIKLAMSLPQPSPSPVPVKNVESEAAEREDSRDSVSPRDANGLMRSVHYLGTLLGFGGRAKRQSETAPPSTSSASTSISTAE